MPRLVPAGREYAGVMSKRMLSPTAPRPFGSEVMATKSFDEVVQDLGVAHRSRAALWALVAAGPAARSAVRRGLTDPVPAVRRGCCEFLDLYYWDDETAHDVIPLLADPDPNVSWMAGHALSCERCKNDNDWAKRPPRP
jgi:hypothetical protein